jgi:hypothetical protein
MQHRIKSSSETLISPAASVGARVAALEVEELEAVLDVLLLWALAGGALEAVLVLVLVLLVLVLVAAKMRSAARISASMSSKSSSVCAGATVASRRLPFLLLFGILRGA